MKGNTMERKNNISTLKAIKKWDAIPEAFRQRIIDNVFCIECGVTTIVDFSITADKFGILLTGKCRTCGGSVARLIEND